jgi:hypothetical protein
MPTVYEIPVDLPSRYYPAMGEIIARCAILENQMRHIIWRASGIDNRLGRVLTVGMEANVLIATVKNLSDKWGGHATIKQGMNSVANQARPLFKERNLVAHGIWGYPIGRKPRIWRFYRMFEAQDRVMPAAVKKSPKDLAKIAAQLRRLNLRAEELIGSLEHQEHLRGSV